MEAFAVSRGAALGSGPLHAPLLERGPARARRVLREAACGGAPPAVAPRVQANGSEASGRHGRLAGSLGCVALAVASQIAPLRGAGAARRPHRRAVRRRGQAPAVVELDVGTAESRELILPDSVRGDFPALAIEAHAGVPLVYLDSGATSQKPTCVMEALNHYYESSANVHRGAYALAERATEAFESARESVAKLIGARSEREVVFTSGATDAINLVANSWGSANLGPGDRIVITEMEHHSDLVPWQLAAQRTGAELRYAHITPSGELDVEEMESLITPNTKLVAFAHVSNVLGCINPVRRIVAAAKAVGAHVLLDACQSVPHLPVNVQELGVDWLAASGHKMCGPTGVGFLWGREEVLSRMAPWKGGGEMIEEVSLEGSTYAEIPARFEAGTPPIAQAVGLGAACEYLMRIGMDKIAAYERRLSRHLWDALAAVEGLRLYGPSPHEAERAALVSFNDTQEGVYPADIALLLDADGYAIRAGHHCAQPLHKALGAPFGSARASLSFYNTEADIDGFVTALREELEMLRAGEGCVFDPDDPEACFCSSSRMRS